MIRFRALGVARGAGGQIASLKAQPAAGILLRGNGFKRRTFPDVRVGFRLEAQRIGTRGVLKCSQHSHRPMQAIQDSKHLDFFFCSLMKQVVVFPNNFDGNRMLIVFVVSTLQNFPIGA